MAYAIVDAIVGGNPLTIRMEYSGGNPQYVGKAVPGTLSSEAAWQMQRLTYVGGDLTLLEWADAGKFTQVWDDRASLSYS
jgi:hypothetical protein